MTEDQLLTAVLELAKFAGWRVCHFRPARTSMGWKTAIQGHKGWPDLAMVKGKRFLVAELKSRNGTTTLEQTFWLRDLLRAGVEVHVWRPADWDLGTIAEALGCEGGIINRREER